MMAGTESELLHRVVNYSQIPHQLDQMCSETHSQDG